MKKKSAERPVWFWIALGCVLVSILSLFLPIFRYGSGRNEVTFNIVDLVSENEEFVEKILRGYHGPMEIDITGRMVTVMAVLAVLGLVLAIVGLVTLRAQRPRTWNFIITIIGLVVIMIPSVIAMVVVFGFGQYYADKISLGIAPILAPIALLLCIAVVVRRKRKLSKEMRKLHKEVEGRQLVRKAGEL